MLCGTHYQVEEAWFDLEAYTETLCRIEKSARGLEFLHAVWQNPSRLWASGAVRV